MTTPERQHQVPRFYLDRFARAGHVLVRRRDGTAFPANPLDVAVESRFYAIPTPGGGKWSEVKRLLARIEALAKGAIDAIDRTGDPRRKVQRIGTPSPSRSQLGRGPARARPHGRPASPRSPAPGSSRHGTPRDEDLRQIETAERALAAGIAAARPGNRLGDVSAAVGGVIRGAGYQVNTAFGGHGVGRVMHGPPEVPNDGVAGRGLALQPGLVIAIEPWFLAGSPKIVIDGDGWTIRSVDRSRGVHVEHTVAITVDGPLVLTARDAVAASAPVRAASRRLKPLARSAGAGE